MFKISVGYTNLGMRQIQGRLLKNPTLLEYIATIIKVKRDTVV